MWGQLGLVLMGGAMLSKSLIPFSVDGWGCVLSQLFDLRPNYGGGSEDNGDLLQKVSGMHCGTRCPQACGRPLLTYAPTGDLWTLTGQSGSVSCDYCSFFLSSDAHRVLFVPSKSLFPQSCVSSVINPTGLQSQILWEFSVPLPDPRFGNLLWVLELS